MNNSSLAAFSESVSDMTKALNAPFEALSKDLTATLNKVNEAFRKQSAQLQKVAAQIAKELRPLAKKRAAKAALVAILSRFLPASIVHKLFAQCTATSALSPAIHERSLPSHRELSLTIHAPNSPPQGSATQIRSSLGMT